MNTWYNIKASTRPEKPTEVMIYDEIGGWGVTAAQFVRDVKAIGDGPINVRINSPGGSVFDGLAIYHYLSNRKDVTVTIDGIAASIASIIAMAGSKRVMPESAYLMIHNPWTGAIGDANDLREQADLLDKLGETLAGIYAKCTKKTKDTIRSMMDAETWIDGATALADGFVTEVSDCQPIKANIRSDRFTHTPQSVVKNAAPSELEVDDDVSWVDGASVSYGEIVEISRDGTLNVPDAGISIVATPEDPAALVKKYQPVAGTDAFIEGELMVGLNFSQLTKIEDLKVVEVEDTLEQQITMEKLLTALAVVGLVPSAQIDEDAAVAAFNTAFASVIEAHKTAIEALTCERDALKAKLDEAAKVEISNKVETAIKEGRIKSDLKDQWIAQISADSSALELLNSISAPVIGAEPVGAPAAKTSVDLRAEFDAITDPKKRSAFWSANKAQLLKK